MRHYEQDILKLSSYLEQMRKTARYWRKNGLRHAFLSPKKSRSLVRLYVGPILCQLRQLPTSVNQPSKSDRCSKRLHKYRRQARRKYAKVSRSTRHDQMTLEYEILRELQAVFKEQLYILNNGVFTWLTWVWTDVWAPRIPAMLTGRYGWWAMLL